MDEALIARRPAGAIAVRLTRAGRTLELPPGKPVVLLQDDELQLAELRLRVHVHGFVDAVSAPEWFVPPMPRRQRSARAASAAAALAFGAAFTLGAVDAAAGRDKPPVEIRARPPSMARPRPKPTPKKPKRPKKPSGKKGAKGKAAQGKAAQGKAAKGKATKSRSKR